MVNIQDSLREVYGEVTPRTEYTHYKDFKRYINDCLIEWEPGDLKVDDARDYLLHVNDVVDVVVASHSVPKSKRSGVYHEETLKRSVDVVTQQKLVEDALRLTYLLYAIKEHREEKNKGLPTEETVGEDYYSKQASIKLHTQINALIELHGADTESRSILVEIEGGETDN